MPKLAKPDNFFKKIKLVNKEILIDLPRPLTPVQGESNPKKRFLHDISAAILHSEKANLLNHTVVKANIIKKEILFGDKVSKLLRTKKNGVHTKTNVRNHYDVALYAREQTTGLLKKIIKRIGVDKSEPFDFNALNSDIKALHGHYQDKVFLHDAELDNKAAAKSMRKLDAKLKKVTSPTQKVLGDDEGNKNSTTRALEKKRVDQEKLFGNSAEDAKKYKAKILQWQQNHPKPKSKLNKAVDFVTEPLMPTLKQAQKQPRKSDRGVARDAQGAKKPDAAHLHSVVAKMRSGLSEEVNEQRAPGIVAPSARAESHVKVAKSQGR